MKLKLLSSNTVLLIVDMQIDFCSPKGLSAKRGLGLKHISKIILALDDFYREMKKKNMLIIFTQWLSTGEYTPKSMQQLYDEEKLTPLFLCVENTEGSKNYIPKPDNNDIIIKKYTYDPFSGTNLKKLLEEKGIENIIITGIWTDVCVDITAKRAFTENYNVVIVEDLVSTIDDRYPMQKTILDILNYNYGFVMKSHEILNQIIL